MSSEYKREILLTLQFVFTYEYSIIILLCIQYEDFYATIVGFVLYIVQRSCLRFLENGK